MCISGIRSIHLSAALVPYKIHVIMDLLLALRGRRRLVVGADVGR